MPVRSRMRLEYLSARVREGEFEVDTDRARLDLDVIHGFLTNCYWSPGVTREIVERAIAASLCFGIYRVPSGQGAGGSCQVGFARAVTDGATYSYLADVFVLPEFRGRGLSVLLMRVMMGHPDLQGLRRQMLLTRDAHGLYARFGYGPCAMPERVMEIRGPRVGTA